MPTLRRGFVFGPPTTAFVAGILLALVPAGARSADLPKGEGIYKKACASCHGASGEGTPKEYPKPLAGDKSVAQLQKLIARTMPADDPGTCVGEDARQVAEYLHEAFYSRTAQERNKPARVELSRLTVRQYRNTIADLIAADRPGSPHDDRHGLQAEYFRTKQFRRDQRTIERIDPEVRFDFGAGRPPGEPAPKVEAPKDKPKGVAQDVKTEPAKVESKDKDKEKPKEKTQAEKDAEREARRKEREKQKEIAKKKEEERQRAREFGIRWQGSVFAPETGDYDFIVRTDNAITLWVNDPKHPLIDASVKSGNDTEYRAAIRLLGGRWYQVRLEYLRGQEKTGSVALEWKPPKGVAGVIPSRHLSPMTFPKTFVLTTPFPPDDRSLGYERGSSVSAAWEQATTDAAIEVATYVGDHLRELTGVMPSEKGREARLREFIARFAERAFRRPLTDQEIERYVERTFRRAPDVETAVKRSVLIVLKSARFLYHDVEGDEAFPYTVASRLSFGLWDSVPDASLLSAAASGKLSTREQVKEQAWRMLDDPRARSKVRDFLFQWLKVDPAPDLAKDRTKIPDFDEAIVADLRTSLDLFLADVIWGEKSDYRQLLLADTTYLNGRLAKFYGADLPADAPFRKVALQPGERAGVLSHPYLLATFAYSSTSSPIHRGVFLARNVLGKTLRPPPEAVAPLAPDLHAGLSTRERVALQTSPTQCQSCHGMINPLGFSLERFDAVGRYRAEEKGRPVDASGGYQVPNGETVAFHGARDLAAFLATSDEAHSAFVERLFHDVVKQPVLAYGSRTLPDLRQSFVSHDYDVRKLLVEVVATTALSPRLDPKTHEPGKALAATAR